MVFNKQTFNKQRSVKMSFTYDIIGYPSSGPNFIVTRFQAPQDATEDRIKELARNAISKTSFASLPVRSLTLKVDSHYKYVHILDIMNVNWAR
jgi:hypothetical protein